MQQDQFKNFSGIATGELRYYNEFKGYEDLEIIEVSNLFAKYVGVVEEQRSKSYLLDDQFKSDKYEGRSIDWAHSFCLINSKEFQQDIKKTLFNERISLYSAFKRTFKSMFTNGLYTEYCKMFKKKDIRIFRECLEYVGSIIASCIQRLTFYEQFKDIKSDIIIYANDFFPEMFYNINPNIKGMVFKKVTEPGKLFIMSNEFSMPCVIADDPGLPMNIIKINSKKNSIETLFLEDVIKSEISKNKIDKDNFNEPRNDHHEKYKLYLCNDNPAVYENMKGTDWINGICFYKTEFLYVNSCSVLSRTEICNELGKIIDIDRSKEFFVSLPNLKEDQTLSYLECYSLEQEMFLDFLKIFTEFFEGVKLAQIRYRANIKLVIPQTRNNDDFHFWKMIIDYYYRYEEYIKPQVGIIVDNMFSVDSAEEYEDYDFAIIDIDGWIESINPDFKYSNITLKDYSLKIKPDIKWIHSHFIKYGIKKRHIVVGHCIGKNPNILYTLINSGFTEFGFPAKHFEQVKSIINKKIESIGKWIGVAEIRKIRHLEVIEEKKKGIKGKPRGRKKSNTDLNK